MLIGMQSWLQYLQQMSHLIIQQLRHWQQLRCLILHRCHFGRLERRQLDGHFQQLHHNVHICNKYMVRCHVLMSPVQRLGHHCRAWRLCEAESYLVLYKLNFAIATMQHSLVSLMTFSTNLRCCHSIQSMNATAWHGRTQQSTARHSTAQHGTAPHSPAQHSTAQYSTAQHSAAQYLRQGRQGLQHWFEAVPAGQTRAGWQLQCRLL